MIKFQRFYSFKLGEVGYAYPFALAILDQINASGSEGFDCVVPIPLSSDKAAADEAHRTRELANELAALLRISMEEYLLLSEGCSKRKKKAEGYTTLQFENFFFNVLNASVPDERLIALSPQPQHVESRRSGCWISPATTGRSRTASTGFRTSSWTRTECRTEP